MMEGGSKEKKRWSLRNLHMSFHKNSEVDKENNLYGSSGQKQRKAKSATDLLNNHDPELPPPTPRTKRRFWSSFRNKARKLRGKSKHKKDNIDGLSCSQPNISTDLNSGTETQDEYERISTMRERRQNDMSSDKSLSDPNVSPSHEARNSSMEYDFKTSPVHQLREIPIDCSPQTIDQDRVDEGDSGIAVIESTAHVAVVENAMLETTIRQRQHALLQHQFYELEIWLKEGRDLVVRDSCGTSDPYVRFKVGNKTLKKSKTIYKNLNPKWDERFVISIEDVYRPIQVKVYDYDRGRSDDPMGATEIDMSTLEINVATDLKLDLASDSLKTAEDMGYLLLQCKLIPKLPPEKEMVSQKSSKNLSSMDSSKKLKMQIWSGVVTIVLVDGKDLMPMDDNGFSDPYVKFRLGSEKYKSKHKTKTLNPKWLEQFDLRLFDDQNKQLELTVYDHDVTGRDDFMGRAVIDLSQIEKERTHVMEVQLEDNAGSVKLLLTISGTSGTETISDLANYTMNPRERDDVIRRYGLFNSLRNLKDIGWLQVKVFKASGLPSADIGGKSDPFCVLELDNARLQTQTEYKTLSPEWNKVFTFNIKDIHSVLEVTVYDEDRDKKVEFLGKVSIPILKIKQGERKWYALKDRKLLHKSRGSIQLELDYVYNPVKAAIRTVNPKEEKYMLPDPKFKISLMKRNIDRVSQIISAAMEVGRFLQSCWDWESKPRSLSAFIVFLVIVWNFEPYMLPFTLLILFIKNLLTASVVGAFSTEPVEDTYADDEDDDDEDDKDKEKEEKKSFKERLQAVQDVCLQVQQGMDMVASLGERIKNTFNWTVPWLSTFAVIILSIGVVILYYIPIRYLLLAWGINKFTKKLRKPNFIPNNELLDFLSRVPSDSELIKYRELRPDVPLYSAKKKRA